MRHLKAKGLLCQSSDNNAVGIFQSDYLKSIFGADAPSVLDSSYEVMYPYNELSVQWLLSNIEIFIPGEY